MYACKNRAPFAPSVNVQDGWETTWARRMVDMEFRLDPNCIYSTSELGQKDKGCHGCKWKAGAGTGTPAEVGAGLHGLPGVRGLEGEGAGKEVPGNGRPSDVAEQRRRFEETWPAAQIYQPTEE